jgi:phosphate acetyltransferase
VHDTPDDPRSATAKAVALCRDGDARALMKGALHSDDLLGVAVSREGGLRTGQRASHVFVMDSPGVDRPLLMTDCVVNIAPDLRAKRDIAQNAIDLAQALGIATPCVAILSAVETVNPDIPGTIDAAALCKMADRGQIRGGVLDGPLAFDNAISADSARNKGIASAVAGRPDVLLVPNLEAGNMVYKELVYLAGADCAGLVLGMRVPIVLTSRSDSVASRVASCALAVLVSRGVAGAEAAA